MDLGKLRGTPIHHDENGVGTILEITYAGQFIGLVRSTCEGWRTKVAGEWRNFRTSGEAVVALAEAR